MILQDLESKLQLASSEYFEVGLKLFHRARIHEGTLFQAAIGNMAIAIELLLKTCIVQKCPKYLFSNLPLEVELKLTYPMSFSKLNTLQLRELNNYEFKSEQLNKCITIFFHLYPDKKKELKPYFNFISDIRNSSVHGILPSYHRIDLARSAFLLLSLVYFLLEQRIVRHYHFKVTKEDQNFLSRYDHERIERLKRIIEDARSKTKGINGTTSLIIQETWDTRLSKCPICKSDSFVDGYCEFEYEKGLEGADAFLTFHIEAFECPQCDLKLFDQVELSYAGVELTQDLSEFIPDYLYDHPHLEDEYDFE